MGKKKKKETARKKEYRVLPEYIGQVRMNREGLIFVRVEGQDEDIYVRAPKSRGALHEDIVRVVETKAGGPGGRRREGEIVSILERSKRPFVGVLHVVAKRQAWVLMSSRTMPYDISVPVPEDPEPWRNTSSGLFSVWSYPSGYLIIYSTVQYFSVTEPLSFSTNGASSNLLSIMANCSLVALPLGAAVSFVMPEMRPSPTAQANESAA